MEGKKKRKKNGRINNKNQKQNKNYKIYFYPTVLKIRKSMCIVEW